MSIALPIPEGFDQNDIENIGGLIRDHPQRAMLLIDEGMKMHVKDTRRRWNAQAQMLWIVELNELWKHHPAGFSSLFEWCRQPEIDLQPSTVSDMLAVARYSPEVREHCETDLFALIEEIGQSKVRQIIPAMRKAIRSGTVEEELTPLLDEIQGSSFRDVLRMVNPGGQRTGWDPEAVYDEPVPGSGIYNLTFRNLTWNELELLATKTGLQRWYDTEGIRIDPPINALPSGSSEDD